MYFLFFQEVLYVSIYCAFLYWILSFFVSNVFLLFFIFGFVKHYLGYYIGIHDMFCNYGDSCLKIHAPEKKYKASGSYLFGESILEGMWFLFWGYIFLSSFKFDTVKMSKIKKIIFIFLLGGATHIMAEFFDLHTYFCREKCKET